MEQTSRTPEPKNIRELASAAYPSIAMLAGIQLEVFTALADGPLSAERRMTRAGLSSTSTRSSVQVVPSMFSGTYWMGHGSHHQKRYGTGWAA